jgi:O-antigen ligase
MKWVFLLFAIATVPALMSWLRGNPQRAPLVWATMAFLPFVMDPLHLKVAPISWAMWPGYVKGMELTLLDTSALAIVLTYNNVRIRSSIFAILAVMIFIALTTMAYSAVPMAAFFYAWQLARIMLLVAAFAKICRDERGPAALIRGMSLGLCVQAGFTIQQYMKGWSQTPGTFDHQNLLGMVTHFVIFPALAIFLAGGKSRAPLLGIMATPVVAILGASRATLGLIGGGVATLLLLSIVRRTTSRKSTIAGLSLIGLLAMVPLAQSSLQNRFERKPLVGNYDERAAFVRAAKMAIAEHPMGLGANQYVVAANVQGYSDRAGVIWNSGSRSANVHNTYLLVWAETGFVGLAAFIALLLTPMMIAFRAAWKNRMDPRGDLMLGLGVCLAVVSVHCFFEWIFVHYSVQMMFAMATGMILGLAPQISHAQSKGRKRKKSIRPAGGMVEVRETV